MRPLGVVAAAALAIHDRQNRQRRYPCRIRLLSPKLGTAPYSPGAKAGNALYVSGTLAVDSAGILVGKGNVKAQTLYILETIKAVVEVAGGSLEDITFNHIFLSDMGASSPIWLGDAAFSRSSCSRARAWGAHV